MATFLQHGSDLRDSERGLKNKFNWSWMERSVAGTDAHGLNGTMRLCVISPPLTWLGPCDPEVKTLTKFRVFLDNVLSHLFHKLSLV